MAFRKLLSPDQLELCFEAPALLPTAEALRLMAVARLHAIGYGKLAGKITVEWNSRMRTTVGRAEPARQRITLNPVLGQFGSGEIERTLFHELAHLLAHQRFPRRRLLPHGQEWRQACFDLGLKNERACHRLPLAGRALRRRFVYRCPGCAREYPRVRRPRRAVACDDCCRRHANGYFDARFRLQLAN